MGGELHQCSPVGFQAVRRRHNTKCFCALRAVSNAVLTVKYAGAGPHPSRGFPAYPWKICVAASCLPCLFCLFAGGEEAGEWFPFCSCSWNFCVARFVGIPCAIVSLHEEAGPHTMKKGFVVCEPASAFALREQRGAAEGATQNRAGIPVLVSHAPGVRRRAVRAGRFLICAAFISPAPRPRAGMSSGH